MRDFGRWMWSNSEKDKFNEIEKAIKVARADVRKQEPVIYTAISKFWEDATKKYRKDEGVLTHNHQLMDEADRDKLAKLKSKLRKLLIEQDIALLRIPKFHRDIEKKYKERLEKNKVLAEEAIKSPVHEKMKYAPPRLDIPGGPGYEEAKASFGKGRTRRHRGHRHTRKSRP